MSPKAMTSAIVGAVIIALMLLVPRFLEWRDVRLDKRAQMLPKTSYVSLGQIGSSTSMKFWVDSVDGSQGVHLSIETNVKKSGSQSEDRAQEIYFLYSQSNPDKFKDWLNIKLSIVIRKDDENGAIVFDGECRPYEDRREIFNGIYYPGRCKGSDLPKGRYFALVTVVGYIPDFKPYNSKLTFYGTNDGWGNFFSELLDQILHFI